jgi:4,5-dihydroxyphthalate decarboxylase
MKKLLISFHPNPRVAPLVEGRVKPVGVDLEWDTGEIGGAFMRALTKNDFDVFEFSISHYIATRGHANPAYAGWIAVPVFASKPSAIYRGLFLRDDANIRTLADLRGKRLGIPDFSMTGGIAIRVMLRTLYGIRPQEITWVNTRPTEQRHDTAMGFDRATPTGIRISNIAEGVTPQQMIERGELDAVVGAPNAPVEPAPGIRRFPLEQWVEVLAATQRAIGITPVNHTLLVQKRLVAERPELPLRLYEAFERSKAEAYKTNPAARAIFPDFDLEAQRRAFGDDPYPYGLSKNRQTFELVAEQLEIDGIIKTRPDVDSLIAESVRGT